MHWRLWSGRDLNRDGCGGPFVEWISAVPELYLADYSKDSVTLDGADMAMALAGTVSRMTSTNFVVVWRGVDGPIGQFDVECRARVPPHCLSNSGECSFSKQVPEEPPLRPARRAGWKGSDGCGTGLGEHTGMGIRLLAGTTCGRKCRCTIESTGAREGRDSGYSRDVETEGLNLSNRGNVRQIKLRNSVGDYRLATG